MSKYIFYTFIILSIIGLTGCNNKQEIKKILKVWIGKEIIIPSLPSKIIEKDTICHELFNTKYKILIYVDSTGCTACKLNLIEWRALIKEVKESNLQVCFIFIVNSNDYKLFEKMETINHFYYPVFYDYTSEFNKINKLPKNEHLQTLLLDNTNKILAIGNPATNDNIWNLYKDIMKSDKHSSNQ